MGGEALSTQEQTAPPAVEKWPEGWYQNPNASGQRYWNGDSWTGSYFPGTQGELRGEAITPKEMLWALSLGFSVTGGALSLFGAPVLAFYFPLGFGIAAAALGIAAITRPGDTPWYALLAILGAIAAISLGVSGYQEFSDSSSALENLQQR